MFNHLKARPVFTMKIASHRRSRPDLILPPMGLSQFDGWSSHPRCSMRNRPNEPNSGAFYVLDRKRGVWLWIDFKRTIPRLQRQRF